ncbi:glycosyltransferase [Bradyrhizobium sp. STM 3562]|uniref:glycosyltransferase n=1 Tax=Bradyrhizobium sp. STM 3562 TaxID=578924 RepID=UPI00388FF769
MSSPASFGVNGRYLTQPVTGVQRYAMNVIAAMNEALADTAEQAPIIAPVSARDPGLRAMPLITAGPLNGHLWEQLVLPARWPGRLLNLCNTAPAIKADQVVCIHDTNVFAAPESYGTAFRTTYRLLQPLLARRAARITTVSADSARQIARHLPIRAADIVVLPDGHEHALAWDPALARAAPSIVSEAGRRFVFALGSRARHKNLQLVLDIAPELAAMGLDVIVAGGGAGIYAAEKLSAAPSVKMLGYVTDHDIAYLMDHALCLLFPSWTEGFGLPIVEAMARGCPVVSSDRASMAEVCGDATLLAAPDDPANWVRQVRRLATSAELRNDLAGRGRERVQMFSWNKTAAGYLDLMRAPRTYRPPQAAEDRPLPSIAVVIATRGRGEIVTATLAHLLKTQTLKPAAVIVSCVVPEDAGTAADLPGVTVVLGAPGLPTQRNTGLAALDSSVDLVAFFDDDFVADAGWLEAAARAFRDEPDVAGFTGHVVADGILGPGLSFEDALEILATEKHPVSPSRIEPFSPYGCNMAFRRSAIAGLRFDERLVLYGWQEDRDFGGSVAKRGGRLIKCSSARGVHMGVKGGRVAGDRLGYSQIVNPIYLLRKGTMTGAQVARHIFGNVAKNLMRAPKPEPFIDRRGRLRGNLRGFADVLRGHIEPERAAAIMPVVREKRTSARTALSPSEGRGDGVS